MRGEPVWYGRLQDANGARRTAYLQDDNILSYPDHYVQSTDHHPMDLLAAIIESRGFDKARIGVELDNYYFTAAAYAALTTHLPNALFLDATALVNWRRAIKSEAEIGFMRKAARIVEAMHQRILEKAEPGIRKCDLVAEIYDVGIRGVSETGGDLPSHRAAAAVGTRWPPRPHLTWNDQPLRKGEGTFFEIAGCVNRYHCRSRARSSSASRPRPSGMRRRRCWKAWKRGWRMQRPGMTCEDIAFGFFSVLERHGIIKDNRTGYSIGLSYPPDWGERTMSLRSGRPHRARTGHDLPFHEWAVAGRYGAGDHREHPDHRNRGSNASANVPRELFIKD